jgi:hypothetical protein
MVGAMTRHERWKLIRQGWLRYLTPDERLILIELHRARQEHDARHQPSRAAR